MEEIFKKNNLKLCDWQYTIRHTNANCFKIGEKVFLKSNPEHQMIVYFIEGNNVTTIWFTKTNEMQLCKFSPECILQYKYAGLLVYKQRHYVALN